MLSIDVFCAHLYYSPIQNSYSVMNLCQKILSLSEINAIPYLHGAYDLVGADRQ